MTQWEPLIYTQLVRNIGINLELCSASAVGAVVWDWVLNLWTLWTPDCVRIEWKCRTTSMLENCLVVWGRQGSHTLELVSESLESKFFFGERLTLSPHSKPGPLILFHHCSNFFFFWLHLKACRTLVPLPGIELLSPAVERWSPNHWTWTDREFPEI